MRHGFIAIGFSVLSAVPSTSHSETQATEQVVFRYHIPNEPHSLDPAKITSTDASYFFNNIMRGLYSYSSEGNLKAEDAESCQFETPLKLICKIDQRSRWSDGKPVTADDYVRGFRHLTSANSKNAAIELLKNVKNLLPVNRGQTPVESLGVRSLKSGALVFEFERPDPDFLYKLTASLLVPVRAAEANKSQAREFPRREDSGQLPTNGPYKVASWSVGRRLRLDPNPYYIRGNPKRPPVEVLFVDDDETARTLYEKGELSFLRRLSTHYIATYRNRPDFKQVPIARFDYVGFGADLKDQPDLREALSYSADFRELQKIYDALGIPGCPSLPESLIDKPRCVTFDLDRAKKAFAKVPESVRSKRFKFAFSKLGGDDVKKGAEWFQAQWKKNLGLTVDLEQTENAVFLASLRTNPPALFRKGVGLERPTCLAALETFAPDGPENFLNLKDKTYVDLLKRLETQTKPVNTQKAQRSSPSVMAKKTCGEGVQYLIDQSLLIPLGRIHFTILASPSFRGWSLNEMNQFDLAGLESRGLNQQ